MGKKHTTISLLKCPIQTTRELQWLLNQDIIYLSVAYEVGNKEIWGFLRLRQGLSKPRVVLSEYSLWNSQFKHQKSWMCCIWATTFLKTGSEETRCTTPFLKPSLAPLSLARSKTDGGTQASACHWRNNCHCQGTIKKNPEASPSNHIWCLHALFKSLGNRIGFSQKMS